LPGHASETGTGFDPGQYTPAHADARSLLSHDAEVAMPPIEALMPWRLGIDYPRWTETLRDQSRVVIRPICATDAAAERDFIESLSPEARRFRFLGDVHRPSSALIEHLTRLDYVHDLGFAAVVPDGAREKFVGVSRYSTPPDGTACECAITVLDDWQHKGLGVILMTHLIDVARSRGIRRMWSMDSAENTAMSDLARYLGFEHHQDPEDGAQVIHSLWL
jgi:GNAT superfamily N-acetyltransferase